MIYTAIMGHGTVGSGVAEILIGKNELMNEKICDDIAVKYILDLRDFEGLDYSDKFIKDFNIILNDPEVKIVAEVMGGINPAYDFVKSCLSAGKSVVTSNKELVAAKGAELLKIAKENNVNFLFEASVGGGIPIIRPMAQCLAANNINKITGILNGTTNYILDKMIVDNMDFDTALKLAQDKGFAERNPAADIEGHDACRKICILASRGFGKHIYPDRPTLVSRENILSGVNGVFNAITVNGDATGDVMFYGKGAGKLPTASAVVADMLDCAKHLNARKYLFWEEAYEDYVVIPDENVKLYVYLKSDDFDKLSAQVKSVFGNTAEVIENKFRCEIALITPEEQESVLKEKIGSIGADCVKIMHTLF